MRVHFYLCGGPYWSEKIDWCRENLYHGGNYEPNWYQNYPYICFKDEKEYAWFILRWK